MTQQSFAVAIVFILLASIGIFLLSGCSINGRPMRFAPSETVEARPKGSSWFIEGKTTNGARVSCSFVEFDERGDFIEFNQHTNCQERIRELVQSDRLLLVIYCHGWKNNSQSGDVTHFNSFLAKLAESEDLQKQGFRVHGVYLGWRGNPFPPYVDKSSSNESYQETTKIFGEPIVDAHYQRRFYWSRVIPENLSYWNRKGAAEHLVSGLPMARAIFTYASGAKGYGTNMDNRVCVMGHSFGALMLERSLGQGLTGELTMEWWQTKDKPAEKIGLPFDLIFFVNSAAPAIYAKEMRDFLEAHRRALERTHNPAVRVPVIVSLTSTADCATGVLHPLGNALAPFSPSLKRRYTSGIFGNPPPGGGPWPVHRGIRQSEFYTRTPGHQPYLINHWIVKDDPSLLPSNPTHPVIFTANLSTNDAHPDIFLTSKAKYPAGAWRITTACPDTPVILDGLTPSMPNSDYWILSCGKELIGGHNDVWSTTTMEMYAGIFRAVESRRKLFSKPKSELLQDH